jgi:two-component sensor histidine kinase/putative methionine-R-sulfoxide reductase with GAF domain
MNMGQSDPHSRNASTARSQEYSGSRQEEPRRTQELATLYAVSAAINQAMSVEEALERSLDQVLDVLSLDGGKVYLLDDTTLELTQAAARGDARWVSADEPPIIPGQCLCGIAVQSGESLQAVDPAQDSRIVREACRGHDWQTCAAVPLLAKERMMGVLHVVSRRRRGFSDEEMALLRSVGAHIGIAIENMRLREEARRADALATLLQEMHHRIKNNLQTVADLLSLEMSASPSPAARKSLRDSISRIKSIAAVHELLSVEQLRLTNITELAQQVCDISLRHFVRPDQRVSVQIDGPDIYLPSKQATALALVMNELIANALEHAFQYGRPGQLNINLAQEGNQVTVSVADNGRGLPPDFDSTRQSKLGLQIVQTLVEKDLAGTLRLENRSAGGSQAILTFYK